MYTRTMLCSGRVEKRRWEVSSSVVETAWPC
jgi:hypothetical protein